MLNGREADTRATWLQRYSEIQMITRDRASCYSEGASAGALRAIQVVDRFQLMQNLRQAQVGPVTWFFGQMADGASERYDYDA